MAALIHLAFILIFNQYLTFQEPSFPQAVRMRRIAAGSGLIILMVSFNRFFFALLPQNTNIWFSDN